MRELNVHKLSAVFFENLLLGNIFVFRRSGVFIFRHIFVRRRLVQDSRLDQLVLLSLILRVTLSPNGFFAASQNSSLSSLLHLHLDQTSSPKAHDGEEDCE